MTWNWHSFIETQLLGFIVSLLTIISTMYKARDVFCPTLYLDWPRATSSDGPRWRSTNPLCSGQRLHSTPLDSTGLDQIARWVTDDLTDDDDDDWWLSVPLMVACISSCVALSWGSTPTTHLPRCVVSSTSIQYLYLFESCDRYQSVFRFVNFLFFGEITASIIIKSGSSMQMTMVIVFSGSELSYSNELLKPCFEGNLPEYLFKIVFSFVLLKNPNFWWRPMLGSIMLS